MWLLRDSGVEDESQRNYGKVSTTFTLRRLALFPLYLDSTSKYSRYASDVLRMTISIDVVDDCRLGWLCNVLVDGSSAEGWDSVVVFDSEQWSFRSFGETFFDRLLFWKVKPIFLGWVLDEFKLRNRYNELSAATAS